MQIGVSASLLASRIWREDDSTGGGAQYEKTQPPANKMGMDKRPTCGIAQAWSIDVE